MLLLADRKLVRAHVVRAYMAAAGYTRAVCFSCGNASRALAQVGVEVVDVSPSGTLVANGWWTPAQVRRCWPDALDATSGHLPLHVLAAYGHALVRAIGPLDMGQEHVVPTGSGETVLALRLALPSIRLVAAYNVPSLAAGTRWHPDAPLNSIVAQVARCEYGGGAQP